MPLINVKMLEGVFTPKQKQEIIRKFTRTRLFQSKAKARDP